MAAPGGTATIANEYTVDNEISGGIEMRFSNEPSGPWSDWEPFSSAKQWLMNCEVGTTCTVYAQFKDAAGNESLVTKDDIRFSRDTYLPIIYSP